MPDDKSENRSQNPVKAVLRPSTSPRRVKVAVHPTSRREPSTTAGLTSSLKRARGLEIPELLIHPQKHQRAAFQLHISLF